jgi:hypothetical protein
MSRERDGGNAAPALRDNDLVHAIAELMEVIRDLCRYAAAFRLVGEAAWFEALTEQCGELLAHRARLVAGLRNDSADGTSQPPRGAEWTN